MDYVDLKIDTDRMKAGEEVARQLRGKRTGGIPWMVILEPSGDELVTSDGPGGNVGCPMQKEEIEWFMTMLGKTRSRLTAKDLHKIEEALKAYADKVYPRRRR